MPHFAVAAVECLRNHTVEVAHQPLQVRVARVQHEAIVIAHQAKGQHLRIKALHALPSTEQRVAVGVLLEDRLAPVTAGGDLVDYSWELDAQGTSPGTQDCGVGAKSKT